MALRSTIHKAQLAVADLDRGHYADHALTLARHPSETEERLMVRLLAYALHADPALAFGRGLSSEGEPDLALRDDTGRLRLWIEVGLPDEKWVRKACGRAERVVVLAYGGSRADMWWRQNEGPLARCANLAVVAVDAEASASLARLAARSMRLSATVQDGQAWLSDGEASVAVVPRWWKGERESAG